MIRRRKPEPAFCIGGFTLLELTVAAALAGIMAAAVVALGSRGLAAWQKAEGQLGQMFRTERALERIGRDLRNAVPVIGRPFESEPERLVFVVAEGPETLAEISYHLDGQGAGRALIRERSAYPAEPSEAAQRSEVAVQVRSFSVECAVPAEGKMEGKITLSWSPGWNSAERSGELPVLVRWRVESEDAAGRIHSVAREVWIPRGGLGTTEGV